MPLSDKSLDRICSLTEALVLLSNSRRFSLPASSGRWQIMAIRGFFKPLKRNVASQRLGGLAFEVNLQRWKSTYSFGCVFFGGTPFSGVLNGHPQQNHIFWGSKKQDEPQIRCPSPGDLAHFGPASCPRLPRYGAEVALLWALASGSNRHHELRVSE